MPIWTLWYLTGFTIDGLGPGIDDHTALPDADGILNAGTNTIKVHLTYSSKELALQRALPAWPSVWAKIK
jgi:hypothetical protein